MFLYFLCWHLITLWHGVAGGEASYELIIAFEFFDPRDGRTGFRFRGDAQGNTIITGGAGDLLAPVAANTRMYYLCDGVTPSQVDKPTVLGTSPNKNIYHHFTKRPAVKVVTRYLSVLKHAVLEAMRPILFGDITMDELRERFAVVGGVLRAIRQHYSTLELIRRLETAADACRAQDLVAGQGGFQKTSDVSDVLLHFFVDENDDTVAHLDFASQLVMRGCSVCVRAYCSRVLLR